MPGVEMLAAVRLSGQYRAASGPPAPGVVNMNLEQALNFTTGSGVTSGYADLMYEAAINIAASSTSVLDLAGSLVDAFGNTITFARIKAIIIMADSTNVNDIVVGNTAANQFTGPLGGATHTVACPPGGFLAMGAPATGWTVTAATGDNLKLANSSSGSAVTGKLIIIGGSA